MVWQYNKLLTKSLQSPNDTCCDTVTIEVEWSATWAAWGGADEVVLAAVSQWLWDWWLRAVDYRWRPSIHNCEVQTCWTSSVYSAVLSVLELASNYGGLVTITNTCMAETSAAEAHPMWVYIGYTHYFCVNNSIVHTTVWWILMNKL